MVFYYCLVSCGPNKFECKNNHWWKQCLEDKHRCDGLTQCADQSDETGCRKLYNLILLHERNDSKTQWWKWNEPIRFKGEKMWRLQGNKRRIRNVAIWLVLPIFSLFKCLSLFYRWDKCEPRKGREISMWNGNKPILTLLELYFTYSDPKKYEFETDIRRLFLGVQPSRRVHYTRRQGNEHMGVPPGIERSSFTSTEQLISQGGNYTNFFRASVPKVSIYYQVSLSSGEYYFGQAKIMCEMWWLLQLQWWTLMNAESFIEWQCQAKKNRLVFACKESVPSKTTVGEKQTTLKVNCYTYSYMISL